MRIVAVSLLAAALAWSRASAATPDFPQVVVQYLSLSAITVDPPQGCKLCHPTDSGGTSLSPFGSLVLQDGATPYNDSSLRAALALVQLDEPQLIEDIKAGRDPNTDANAGGAVHAPQYGCGLAAGSRPAPLSIAAVVSIALLAAGRRRRRRNP
jgi:MYXO-CTERM domain-containing protein